jgi:transcription factor Ssl1
MPSGGGLTIGADKEKEKEKMEKERQAEAKAKHAAASGGGSGGDEVGGRLVLRCEDCGSLFCVDCDLFIHDSLHNCPGCC